MKVIELVTTVGSVWTVPAEIVCRNRASYFKAREGSRANSVQEFDFCMENDDEIIDWAGNNMDWSDVAHHARKVSDAEENMAREWGAGDMDVIEQPSSSG